ncbi:HAD-like domain-containing protein [Cladorrhinum sp. PSN259]|nr:HAD-like domain-containing protein [Cladorrhinum sp. PSN259]
MEGKKIIAFDLYGTILSTESIAEELVKNYGQDASKTIAANWRRYQLEYTWRLNSMGTYRDFEQVTRASLHHALAELNLKATPEQEANLMESYNRLHFFPDAHDALGLMDSNEIHSSIETCIFSNGTVNMITESTASFSSSVFKNIVTVEDVKVFKPDRRTYEHLLKRYGKEDRPEDVWLVSSNPFDVVGAVAAGLKATWVDRTGKGWVDQLGDAIGDVRPTVVVQGVKEAVQAIISESS